MLWSLNSGIFCCCSAWLFGFYISLCVYHKISHLLGRYLISKFTVSLFLNFWGEQSMITCLALYKTSSPPKWKENFHRFQWVFHLTPFVSRVLSLHTGLILQVLPLLSWPQYWTWWSFGLIQYSCFYFLI